MNDINLFNFDLLIIFMANKISAGSYDLNRFLQGGYDKDIITTIYGPGGSGKSNLCMSLCVSRAKKGDRVIFIDSEGSFSVDRFRQIHGDDKSVVDKDIENVLVLNPTSFAEQEKAFSDLAKQLKLENISLIIVDSIGMLYRLELAQAAGSKEQRQIQEVNAKMAKQLMFLNEIARKQNIPVVVTNQVYSNYVKDFDDKNQRQVNMVGGDLLKYWSKCLIELQNSFGRRKLVLRKHRSIKEKEMGFEIINSGIKKRGLF